MISFFCAACANLAGLRLHAGISPAGRRLAVSRGLIQVFSSALFACGLTAFLGFVLAAGDQGPTWSWGIFAGCWALVLVFDAAFNVVLNLVRGKAAAMLGALRLALTLLLSVFTGQLILLFLNGSGIQPSAREIAERRFQMRLGPLVTEVERATKERVAAEGALADFLDGGGSGGEPAALPCDGSLAGPLADDPAARRFQLRDLKRRQAHCDALMAASVAAARQRASARAAMQGRLAASVDAAGAREQGAQRALDAARRASAPTIAAEARSVPVQLEALAATAVASPLFQIVAGTLMTVILIIETLAIVTKAATQSIDQAALHDRAALAEQCALDHVKIEADELMRRAARKADRSGDTAGEAGALRTKALWGELACRSASVDSEQRRRKLEADMELR